MQKQMSKPTMIEVWDIFSLEEKQGMCMAFKQDPYERKDISVGALALFPIRTVRSVIGRTAYDNKLGMRLSDAQHLWFKLKEVDPSYKTNY